MTDAEDGPLDLESTLLLATELELIADFDLAPLVAGFGAAVSALRRSSEGGTWTAWLELSASSRADDLDGEIREWVALVDALPVELRSMWDACRDRCLATGIQSGRRPRALRIGVAAPTLAAAARSSVRLELTVYALDGPSR